MSFKVVRFGTERAKGEGLRIGTVRRPPRGVRKDQYGELNYFDTWLPELSPSADLVSWANATPLGPQRLSNLRRKYRAQMKSPANKHLIQLLATLSHKVDFSIGCYCPVESQCHRSILKELLIEQGAKFG
jgi:uncharacterized protein YeaO (DUF488 family)